MKPADTLPAKPRRRFRLIPRFDPRLAADLKAQRRPIIQGLICVAITSLLTASTIPLIERSVRAIGEAQPVAQVMSMTRQGAPTVDADVVAQELGVTPERANEVIQKATGAAPRPEESQDQARSRQRKAVETLGWVSLLVVGVYALKYWFTRGQTYFLSKASAKLSADLRVRLFAKLQRLPVSYFSEKRAGQIQSVLTNDVNVYQGAVTIIRDSIDAPIKAIAALATIIIMQWQLAAVTMLFLPVMALFIQRNARKMKVAQAEVQDDLGELNAMAVESLQGTRVIKAFNAEGRIQDQYAGLVDRSFRSQMRAVIRQATLRPMVELIGAVALALIFYICGWLAFNGMLQVSEIAALVYALDVINQGFRQFGYMSNTYASVEAASERIYREVLDVPDGDLNQAGSRTLPNPIGRIEFRNVSFTYPDGTRALSNVSFVIEPGTSLALVGQSGAGKSTIADLVLRFYDPTEGEILFDGVDLRELSVSWLRSQIGVVPQQTFLFAGTIEDNIRLGAPNATEEDVNDALRRAHAEEFTRAMNERSNALLGERGVKLSGGQMQRVAIARALVRKPTLLLLDEATSALDANSEKVVTEALTEVMQERTTLFIAHRLTTAARADRILHLRGGKVVESGSHRELMERNGAYADMYRAFAHGVIDETAEAR